MSNTVRVVTLGDRPKGAQLLKACFLGGFPFILLLIAFSIRERSPIFLLMSLLGGGFPLFLIHETGKNVQLNASQIPAERLETIDLARKEAGLTWLQVTYVEGNDLPYPVVLGTNLTLSRVTLDNLSYNQIAWAVRSGARTTTILYRRGCIAIWIGCLLMTMASVYLPKESAIQISSLVITILAFLAASYFVPKSSELAGDQWATQSPGDRANAEFVLKFAIERQLERPRSQRFLAIPIYELKTRAKHLGLTIE